MDENFFEENDFSGMGDDFTPKKKVGVVLLCLFLVIGVILLGLYFFSPKEEKKEEPSSSNTEEPVQKTITLEEIVETLDTKALEEKNFSISIQENLLVFSTLIEEEPFDYVFELKNQMLVFEIEEETEDSQFLLFYVMDAIGQLNGNKKGEVLHYLETEENPKEIKREELEGEVRYSVSVTTKFSNSI